MPKIHRTKLCVYLYGARRNLSMKKTVIIAGASGLVGHHLLDLLLEEKSFEKVYSLVRKPSGRTHPKLEEINFDFNNEEAYANLPEVDSGFCCLGTTIKKAGSQKAFKKVDYHYPLLLAQSLKNNNCRAFHVITALGADSSSRIFYNQVKGELEDALSKLEFNSLNIYQPSLLLGDRKEQRLGEKIAMIFMPPLEFLLQGKLKKYRSIQAKDVAKGILANTKKENNNIQIIPSNEIKELAYSLVHTK